MSRQNTIHVWLALFVSFLIVSHAFVSPTKNYLLATKSQSSLVTLFLDAGKEEANSPNGEKGSGSSVPSKESRICNVVENGCNPVTVTEKDEEVNGSDPQREMPEILTRAVDTVMENSFVLRRNTTKLRSMFLGERSYAKSRTFAQKNLNAPPVVEDLFPEPTPIEESFPLSVPASILTFLISSAIFPTLATFLVSFVDLPPEKLDDINSKLVPGIAILYGTFMSLTLSILYNRQRSVQDTASQETSLLSFLLHNMVSLFKRDRNRMVRSGQCAADQVRILLRENRGIEYMNLIYTDPYMRLLELVEEEEERLVEEHGDFLSKGPILSTCRETIKDLRVLRARRLSDESLFLPPTHYFILKALTFLLLLGYFFSVLPAVDELGYVPFESTLLFGTLTTVYLLFYSFADDLNDLYNGVFQIRRGSSASHLLEIKKIISDHPWLRFEVSFERVNREILCFYPGLADVWFENEQNFQAGQIR